ncbi:MAG: tetratricopeptide repeat protein [Pseudomonadota bacterium]
MRIASFLKQVVAAFLLIGPVQADDSELEALFEGLRGADPATAEQIEERIFEIWSQSGSPSMDLLLTRGREALEEGDTVLAIRHFSALIDHSPDFAEGYNGRATAYFQAGRYGLSLEDIRRTLELNPRHFSAMTGLALILQELGYPDEALSAWREVEKFSPNREGLKEAIQRLEAEVEGAAL